MNGAIADPSASISNPPRPHTITITGMSQNFLRIRRNFHSSLAKLSINSSELVGHRRLPFAWQAPVEPVARLRGLQTKPQRVPAGAPHHDSDRSQHGEKHDSHYDRVNDPRNLQRKPSPSTIKRTEDRSGKQRDDAKYRCGDRPPECATSSFPDLKCRGRRAHRREKRPKRPIRGAWRRALANKRLGAISIGASHRLFSCDRLK